MFSCYRLPLRNCSATTCRARVRRRSTSAPTSTTKTAAKYRATPELLRDWSETTVVPCCAIGGITQQNCGPLVEAGADFLAVIGAIWSHPKGPRAAVAEFNEVFARYGRAYRNR